MSENNMGEEIKEIFCKCSYDREASLSKIEMVLRAFGLTPRDDLDSIFFLMKTYIEGKDGFSWDDVFSLDASINNRHLRILAVEKFKLDKILMNYWIHSSYVIYLSNSRYENHDVSKTSALEALNMSMFVSTGLKNFEYVQGHYRLNNHHPEHYVVNESETFTYMDMPDESMREMAIDLAARKWEFEMPYKRKVYGHMLWEVENFIKKKNVDIIRFNQIMREMIPRDKEYFLHDVENVFLKRAPIYIPQKRC